MSLNTLTYLCNTTPNFSKLERNLPLVLPYVDRAVICIGQRDEQAEAFCKSFDKVKLVYYPWDDSFAQAYQACLDHAPKEGWHLRMDDDEVPSLEMLQELPTLIAAAEDGRRADVFSFNCINVMDGVENPSGYYREMFYKWSPGLHYEIDLHQSLVGLRGPCFQAPNPPCYYKHYKSESGMLRSACRDFFSAGVWGDSIEGFPYWFATTGQDPRLSPGGPLVPNKHGIAFPLKTGFLIDSWYEMGEILTRNHPEVYYYRDLDKLIREKRICQEFREWAERHNETNDTRPHLHELYCMDKYLKMESY